MTIHKGFIRRAAAVLAIGAGLAGAGALPGSAAETLRVSKANGASFTFTLIDVGVQKGIFAKHGLNLEVTTLPGAARVVQALSTDTIDIGFATGVEMAFIPKGAPMKAVVAILGPPDQVVVANGQGPIKTVDDLKGKTFSVSSMKAVSAWLVMQLATTKGWGANGVNYTVAPSFQTAMALLKTGQVDGMTFDVAAALQAERVGDVKIILYLSQVLPHFLQYAAFASDKLIETKPETLRAFVAAWLETISYVKANKDETVAIISQVLAIAPDIAAKVYDANAAHYLADGRFDREALEVLRKSYVELELLDKAPDMATLYTEAFLPKK